MEIKRRLMVNNTFGLHSRPASEVVKLAQKFNSETFLYKVDDETKKASCKSVLSILLLGAGKGTELILSSSGPDAENAIDEISGFFNRNFDEDV